MKIDAASPALGLPAKSGTLTDKLGATLTAAILIGLLAVLLVAYMRWGTPSGLATSTGDAENPVEVLQAQ